MCRRCARVNGYDVRILQSGFHLVNGLEAAKHPRDKLQVGYALRLQALAVVLVQAVAGEVEQSGRQPFLVKPLGYELFLFNRQSHVSVLGGERHAAFHASGNV